MAKSHENDPWSGFSSLFYLTPIIFLNLTNPMHVMIGISCFILTMGSLLYHWKTSYRFQKADEVGMYAAFSSVLFAQLFVNAPFELPAAVAVFTPAVITYASFIWHKKLDSFIIMPALYGGSVLLSSQESFELMVWALGLGFVGVGVRQLGVSVFPKYDKYLHSVWHLLTAAGLSILTYTAI